MKLIGDIQQAFNIKNHVKQPLSRFVDDISLKHSPAEPGTVDRQQCRALQASEFRSYFQTLRDRLENKVPGQDGGRVDG